LPDWLLKEKDMFRNLAIVMGCLSVISTGSAALSQTAKPAFISPGDDTAFCGQGGVQCFDSGWVAAVNSTNHTVTIPHNLGTTPRFIAIYFSPTGDDSNVMPVIWPWSAGNSGNPVSIGMTDKQFHLEICSCAPLHGYWTGGSAVWTSYASGSFRIFARK
jgi:hypothetical protein